METTALGGNLGELQINLKPQSSHTLNPPLSSLLSSDSPPTPLILKSAAWELWKCEGWQRRTLKGDASAETLTFVIGRIWLHIVHTWNDIHLHVEAKCTIYVKHLCKACTASKCKFTDPPLRNTLEMLRYTYFCWGMVNHIRTWLMSLCVRIVSRQVVR